MKTLKVCGHCGSEDVFVDANAVWDASKQEWVLGNYLGDTEDAFCRSCDAQQAVVDKVVPSFPDHIREDEAKIIDALITAALNRGLTISVNDGEEWALRESTDRHAIQKEVAATDVTFFQLRNADGKKVGWFDCIHGNGCDVIHDYTDNEVCKAIWKEVEPLTDWGLYS